MPDLSAIAIAIHALGAAVWVGGMFFAYMVLRPSLGSFDPPQRLSLWNEVFPRFFLWVWIIVVALPATGYLLLLDDFGGFRRAGVYIHVMHLIGLVMIGLFVLLYVAPYRRFRDAVAAGEWPVAAGHLNAIRRIVGTNMVLGLITVAVGASGRFWG